MKLSNSLIIILISAVVMIIITLGCSSNPEIIYIGSDFSLDVSSLSKIALLLPDDVMITLRSSLMVLKEGYPRFNSADLAQASTSYLLPYIYALIFYIFPINVSILLISLLGVFMFSLASYVVIRNCSSNSKIFFLLFVCFLNPTTLEYITTGWEHLWQAFFVVYAWSLTYKEHHNVNTGIIIGVFCALAVLVRADSIFLISPIFLFLLVDKRVIQFKKALLVFFFIGIVCASIQYFQFGHLTPTTARLKAGTMPSSDYQFDYLLLLIEQGAAAYAILFLIGIHLLLQEKSLRTSLALLGVLASYVFNYLVSDTFAYGRMFLAPLLLSGLIFSFSKEIKPIREIKYLFKLILISSVFFLNINKIWDSLFRQIVFVNNQTTIMTKTKSEHITPLISNVGERYLISQYINDNFEPTQGSLGLFYAGTIAFFSPEFEVADFLGKGDELIATSEVKWGRPGHNKWNAQLSLDKWDPIIIPFPESIREMPENTKRERLDKRFLWSHWYEFYFEIEKRDYIFCKPFEYTDVGIYVKSYLYSSIKGCVIK